MTDNSITIINNNIPIIEYKDDPLGFKEKIDILELDNLNLRIENTELKSYITFLENKIKDQENRNE